MKLTVKQLRRLVREAGKKIGASPEYMKKEMVREQLQQQVLKLIGSAIKNQKDLDDYFRTQEMAMGALKAIPFEVWQKLYDQTAPGGML